MSSDPTVPIPAAGDSPDGDAELMARSAREDSGAFAALVQRYRGPIFSFASRLLRDPSVAEDVTQEVFVRAWQARARWRPTAKVSTWLFTIARHAALDRNRRARHAERNASRAEGTFTTGLLGSIPDGALTPCSSAQSVELEVAVETALAGLPEAFRLAVVLCSLQGMSYPDAAEVAGVSEKTLSSRLARGREMLRKALAPHLGGEGR